MTVNITSGRNAANEIIKGKEILVKKKIAKIIILHVHLSLEIEDFIFTVAMIPMIMLIPSVTNNTINRMYN